jgi:hypothetical protein
MGRRKSPEGGSESPEQRGRVPAGDAARIRGMPNPNDTIEASKPVEYEIRKFRETHNALATEEYPPEFHDQLVEAYALHLRNLIEFLYDKPEKNHIRATHYFSDPERWRSIAGKRSATLGKAQGQASEQVNHLTYGRVGLTQEEKGWLIGELSLEIVGVLAKFLKHADEDRMGPELLEVKESWGPGSPPAAPPISRATT